MLEKNPTLTSVAIEILASLEHERWARWQSFLHSKCKVNDDGSLTIPPDLVARWEGQISRPYEALSSSEKESDRSLIESDLAHYNRVLEVLKR